LETIELAPHLRIPRLLVERKGEQVGGKSYAGVVEREVLQRKPHFLHCAKSALDRLIGHQILHRAFAQQDDGPANVVDIALKTVGWRAGVQHDDGAAHGVQADGFDPIFEIAVGI
jgi:hypothetical protein